ncbi:MAG: SufS family cysteine desulfurase [Bacteroidales bacterium]|nr:SufS family cysteine desulfurase [Candidatus Cryptobacteroides aphodequi]
MEIKEIRNEFPQLSRTVYGKPLVYLDNAATALKPRSVMACYEHLAAEVSSNIHRSVHRVSNEATAEFENARKRVAEFLNAPSERNIVFTSGTTDSINLIASSYGQAFIGRGDEIVISEQEHHSDIVPWQMLAERTGAVIKVWKLEDDLRLGPSSLEKLLGPKTKIVCVSHASNVLGIVTPIKEICALCHRHNIPVCVDGAQGIVHCKVDVQDLDCDFYSFSGHKIYAATGTGVMYAKAKWLEQMPPYRGGGEMIADVTWERTTYADYPFKFEAGTPNITSVPTLVPAIEMLEQMRSLEESSAAVASYVLDALQSDKRITLYGDSSSEKLPIFSFAVKGAHQEDLALVLDKMGVALRSGEMCAAPLMHRLRVTGLLRASFAPYNTIEEARYFVECLGKAIEMLTI